MKDLGDLMKKAQKMKTELDRVQGELAAREVEASAGGGMVSARVTGGQEVVSISIDPQVIDPDDREMLEDLVRAAINEALRKSREMMQEEMAKITGGLPIPNMF
ncbi:MAG TPA: YbaB/EbfC family nucleoid-associated protein [Proteobacteria bacterium]|nr:nucleoid-associated protein [bacterium BMS3Abin14]HDL52788.1 YbaB/EbfC family nucleoid-associated protein [Pseudomonadota bacterium]